MYGIWRKYLLIADKDKYLKKLLKTIIDIRYVGDSAGLKRSKKSALNIIEFLFSFFQIYL
jgi:hypothetical protein